MRFVHAIRCENNVFLHVAPVDGGRFAVNMLTALRLPVICCLCPIFVIYNKCVFLAQASAGAQSVMTWKDLLSVAEFTSRLEPGACGNDYSAW